MLRTLGGARVEGNDFGRPKPLLLLAYLTLEGPQSRGHLAQLFWPGNPQANRSLTTTLGRLRRAVPGKVLADEVRVWSELKCDVHDLRRNLTDGDLESALALYRGPFLGGLELQPWSAELEEWLYAEREAIAEELRSALVRRARLEAGRGRLEAAAAWAERAVTLAGAGAPEPAALGQLHALLRAVDHPLAVRLEAEAAAYDLPLAASAAAARATLEAQELGDVPHDLPARGGPFVGREVELADLHRALASPDQRLVTLVGPGGTGKTRLALQAARESLAAGFSGVWFVELEAAREAGAATTMLADALGVDAAAGGELLTRLTRHVGAKRYLLVLDNLEQLAGGAALVATLLERCENLKVLVTSRERLGLSAEWVVPLAGLSFPPAGSPDDEARLFDAVQLFKLRARQAAPGFELDAEDLRHVTRLCRLLLGAPLGLELAAALTRVLSCREIADEAERTFDFLVRRSPTETERHRSLRTAFTHSWRLLTPEERAMLEALSVFRGGFDREDAHAVTQGSTATLLALVDKSLVHRLNEGRFGLHPVSRQYAHERLREDAAALRATQERHARCFLALAEAAAPRLKGAEQVQWLGRLAAGRDNLRAALDWALAEHQAELGLRLATALQPFWWLRGPYSEGYGYLMALHDLPEAAAHPLLRGRALQRAGTLYQEQGDHPQASRNYQAAQALAEELGDDQLLADVLHSRGLLASKAGGEDGSAYFERGLALQRELGDRWGVATTLNSMAIAEANAGRFPQARSLLLEALALKQALGDTQGIAYALNNLGALSLELGEPEAARGFLERSLALKRQLDDRGGVANSLANLGDIAASQGRHDEARDLLTQSLRALASLENGWTLLRTLTILAGLEARAGQPERALRLGGGLEALRCALADERPPGRNAALEEATRLATAKVGARVAAQLLLEGGSMSVDELVAFAQAGAAPAHGVAGSAGAAGPGGQPGRW